MNLQRKRDNTKKMKVKLLIVWNRQNNINTFTIVRIYIDRYFGYDLTV